MEFVYGSSNNNDSSALKTQSFNGNVSPINAPSFIGGRTSRSYQARLLDPYASSSSDNTTGSNSSNNILSPLGRYLRSSSPPVPHGSGSPIHRSSRGSRSSSNSGSGTFRSPLASIENIESPPVFRTSVKVVEEDTVVIDGILVNPKPNARAKSSLLTSLDSGGSESSFQKSETCRYWEDSGACRFGSDCRFIHGKEDLHQAAFANRNRSEFVHGKEDLRPAAFANRNQSEALVRKSYGSGSSSYGPRGRSVHQQVQSPMSTLSSVEKVESGKEKEPPTDSTTTTSTIAPVGTDWSPLDDNIVVSLPSGEKCPSREDVDAHIQTVLYGVSGRKRLPVFTDLANE